MQRSILTLYGAFVAAGAAYEYLHLSLLHYITTRTSGSLLLLSSWFH